MIFIWNNNIKLKERGSRDLKFLLGINFFYVIDIL